MSEDFDAEEGDQPTPPATDLLGAPWRELRDPRGRRRLRFKRNVYDRVETFKAAGMSDQEIADAVGVGKATLQRHFGPELDTGAARKRAELLELAMEGARAGKTAAIKLAFSILERGAASPPSARKPDRAPVLGKKEQLAADARSLDSNSSWGRLLN